MKGKVTYVYKNNMKRNSGLVLSSGLNLMCKYPLNENVEV